MKGSLARTQANFYTGLAIVLPAIISIAVFKWLFGTVSNVTDPLLFFLPHSWTHDGTGQMYWWWSVVAILLAVSLVSGVGSFARHFMVKKLIQWLDLLLLRVPLLNKIYGAVKQVNDAFTTTGKTSFRQVVLVRFPSPGMHSIGFLTNDQHDEVKHRTGQRVVSVFIPTTPNPTSGFLVLIPEHDVTPLQMSVSDGIKFIISAGAVAAPYDPQTAVAQSAVGAPGLAAPSLPA